MRTALTTGPGGISWLVSKLVARQQKRQVAADTDAIDNLDRLHKLKEKGVLTEEEFAELKEKLKENIC